MTKLTEWIIFAGLAFSIWITLLTDIIPLKVSYKAKEVIWPVSLEMFDRTCGIKTIHRHSWNFLEPIYYSLKQFASEMFYFLQMPVYALIAFGVSKFYFIFL